MKKIMVTGATGPLGAAVVDSLLKHTDAVNIAALARTPDKAAGLKAKGVAVRQGDYDDYSSLVTAFRDIDKLYFVSGNDTAHRMQQHDNVVRAAREAGVRHIVYTSIPRKDETETSPIWFVTKSHIYTEKLLKEAGLVYTILQHGVYTDMIPVFAGEHLLETKTIYQPSGDGKAAYAVRTDLAEAGANVLLDTTGKYDNKIFQLTGSEAISYDDIAKTISKATGSTISYHSPSVEEFRATLDKAAIPSEVIDLVASFATANKIGEFAQVSDHLETLLGRRPATAAQYLTKFYQGQQ